MVVNLTITEIKNQRFNCSCNISFVKENLQSKEKEILELNIQTNENYFVYLLDMVNYKIFGCPKVISKSSINDIFNNIGFYLGAFLILFNIIIYCFYFFKFFIQNKNRVYKLIPNDLKLYDKAIKLKNKITNSNKNDNSISNPKRRRKINDKYQNY